MHANKAIKGRLPIDVCVELSLHKRLHVVQLVSVQSYLARYSQIVNLAQTSSQTSRVLFLYSK